MSFLKKAARWAAKRAGEKSTWIGIGTVLAGVSPGVGALIGANAATIAVVAGSVLVGATTKPSPA